jgi:hypothetical protein
VGKILIVGAPLGPVGAQPFSHSLGPELNNATTVAKSGVEGIPDIVAPALHCCF